MTGRRANVQRSRTTKCSDKEQEQDRRDCDTRAAHSWLYNDDNGSKYFKPQLRCKEQSENWI